MILILSKNHNHLKPILSHHKQHKLTLNRLKQNNLKLVRQRSLRAGHRTLYLEVHHHTLYLEALLLLQLVNWTGMDLMSLAGLVLHHLLRLLHLLEANLQQDQFLVMEWHHNILNLIWEVDLPDLVHLQVPQVQALKPKRCLVPLLAGPKALLELLQEVNHRLDHLLAMGWHHNIPN